MKRIGYVVAGVALGAIIALQWPSTAQIESPTPGVGERSVTVTGTGTITAAPDEAIVSLGVQTQAGSAQDAMQENAQKMSAVLAAIRGLGIGNNDIATTDVSLYPNYGQNGNAITGYQASNQVDVTVRDMGNIGKVIDAAVGAGANLASGIQFKVSDKNKGVSDALASAVQDSKSKADALAAAAGAQVGSVVSIVENSEAQPYPMRFDVATGAASTPVNPPTLTTQVNVTVVWSLT